MSVGRICDEGHSITFDAVMAVVHAKDRSEGADSIGMDPVYMSRD